MSTNQDHPQILTPQGYAHALEPSFDTLLRILALLDPTEIESTRLADGWTPKALVAHIGFWDHMHTERMKAALVGPEAQAAIPPGPRRTTMLGPRRTRSRGLGRGFGPGQGGPAGIG